MQLRIVPAQKQSVTHVTDNAGAVALSAASRRPEDDATISRRHTWEAPWFCHGMDCPKYDILETDGEVELRRYDPSECFCEADCCTLKRAVACRSSIA